MRENTENCIYFSIGRRTLEAIQIFSFTSACISDVHSGRDDCSCEAGMGNWNYLKVEQYFMQLLASG